MSFVGLRADDYAGLSARVLGRMVAERRVSPVQLAELALALAKAAEPKINAYVSFLEPSALDAAGEREREAREGRLRSAVHGVPIAVKDNFYLKGLPLARGSRTSPDYVPDENAPMVQRLLDAGTVIVGKTTTPEFGWKGTGISPLTGVTRNPWNLECNSGGSSAGSAATVAAGAVPIALGTDAGGSIRIPAAFCGIAGFKPTLGRIPVWPGTVTETLSHARRSFVSAVFKLFDVVDLALTPTMPLVAFDAASEVPPGGEAEAPLPWITWTPYTYPFNLSGQPAISVPCGLAPDGLPVGLQIVGPFGSDALVLAFARQVESALAFRDRHPLPRVAS